MAEFLSLLPPDEARAGMLSQMVGPLRETVPIDVRKGKDRVVAHNVRAPHPLPEFPRSTVDGYAVRAKDTHGASEALPAYLILAGEIPMGQPPGFKVARGHCALIHTGGMLPEGTDAVLMLEYTQKARAGEIETLRAVAEGENVIQKGEEVAAGQIVMQQGTRLRPAEIGGLLALGITTVEVIREVRVGIISSGDEVVRPDQDTKPGQVRDINSYTLSTLVSKPGCIPNIYGIVPDNRQILSMTAKRALGENDILVITAGSSASARDMTADVIQDLGQPGVLVHGINTKPGKPTILGVCDGKAVIGLPGNPVSALINAHLFLLPAIRKLSGEQDPEQASVIAQLTINLPSQAGREDWWPVKLVKVNDKNPQPSKPSPAQFIINSSGNAYQAEPLFGKSNQIFTLAAADGLVRIPSDATGIEAGSWVEVTLI